MCELRLRYVAMSSAALLSAAAWFSPASAQVQLDELFVTATGRPEPPSRIVGTIQVIDKAEIERSTASSVTGLLAEHAVGFLSEWTPGQTQINIRGATTDGQGRDFKSQVLVLINGHRAGTANVSKLSLADIDRIEIVRGPSSVIYGSQNMGGVINIIYKTGFTAPGTFVEGSTGSWGLAQGRAQNGGVSKDIDWYGGVAGGTRGDYRIGGSGGKELNTSWHRRGAAGDIGYQINENNHVDLNVRTDGIYNTGFRGSDANIFSSDDRFNRSFDLNYRGKIPDGRVSWFFQNYGVTDVDDLNHPSPLASPFTTADDNRRQLDIIGSRFQPRVKMWDSNDLLLGWDWEQSWLRSTRLRLPTATSPFDNNQSELVNALYFEDAQTFFNERLTVRGGLRKTFGTTNLDPTPNVPALIPGSTRYQATTYSVGSSWRAYDWLTFRAGASSGFRAPTATELGANFTTSLIGNVTFGNPGLTPETSNQIEAGATFTGNSFRVDAAIFQNVIRNRITTAVLSSSGGVTISNTINNPGDIVVQGVELQADADMIRTLSIPAGNWRWNVFGNGFYNFRMIDQGAPATFNTNQALRMYQYEAALGTRFGQSGAPWHDWSFQVNGILRGPMWYNTEEKLLVPGQVPNVTIFRKDAFWVVNTRGELLVAKGVTLFAAINNIFDVNQHPIFIALDQTPCIANPVSQNGACGNSMPGREFILGFQGRW
jgi:vitamin B12 transporter